MIFADASYQDKLSIPSSVKLVDGLFEVTGVQFVVSDKAFPPSGKLIEKHAENNSAFVLVDEYPCRFGDRNFVKLVELGAKARYHIILGSIASANGDALVYDGNRLDGKSYRDYVEDMAIETSTGVVCTNIERDYLYAYLSKLEKLVGLRIELMPSVVRELRMARDGRVTLASIPIIAEKANLIWNKYKDSGVDQPSLLDIIASLTDNSKNTTPLAKSICAAVRSWFSIPEGWNIGLEPDNDTTALFDWYDKNPKKKGNNG
jgi:hypothetical protein